MSTRSCVIIKLRKEDIGNTIKFAMMSLPDKVSLEEWIDKTDSGEVWRDERGKEHSKSVELKEAYIGIYCHWDGSPSGVGAALKESFNDYDSILNLIAGGFCSVIEPERVRHYANRGKPSQRFIYDNWEDIAPVQGKTAADVYHQIDCQYTYVFDEARGGWLWKEAYSKNSYKVLK